MLLQGKELAFEQFGIEPVIDGLDATLNWRRWFRRLGLRAVLAGNATQLARSELF